jgi:hypothetical protein
VAGLNPALSPFTEDIAAFELLPFFQNHCIMTTRPAYLLTTNTTSERTVSSRNMLRAIGFTVIVVPHIPHSDKVLSNKLSMQHIYSLIRDGPDPYAYVFEDDINALFPITLDEIIQYEPISEQFFYLGMCGYNGDTAQYTQLNINGHPVFRIAGNVRGLHAIGLSQTGAANLLQFSNNFDERYMDMILEEFTRKFPANIVRYDLESYIYGHRGVIFQDRAQFPSSI